MKTNSSTGRLVQLFYEERLMKMIADFSNWRIDPFIRQMEAERKKGRIFPFVRGLRLSAHLIYAIREILEGTSLKANWGQLVDKSGVFCSSECDVVIHRDGHIARWNGTEKPIMDFRFIEQKQTVAVISCKSYLRSGNVDSEYCKLMKPFVKKIWLFAECCSPQSVKNIRDKALRFGYEKFWYLYTWSKQKDLEPNKDGWNEFVKEVRNLDKKHLEK